MKRITSWGVEKALPRHDTFYTKQPMNLLPASCSYLLWSCTLHNVINFVFFPHYPTDTCCIISWDLRWRKWASAAGDCSSYYSYSVTSTIIQDYNLHGGHLWPFRTQTHSIDAKRNEWIIFCQISELYISLK